MAFLITLAPPRTCPLPWAFLIWLMNVLKKKEQIKSLRGEKSSSSCWVTRWLARSGLWIEQKTGRPFWLSPWWQATSWQNSFTLWELCGGMTVLNDVLHKFKVISIVTEASLGLAFGFSSWHSHCTQHWFSFSFHVTRISILLYMFVT